MPLRYKNCLHFAFSVLKYGRHGDHIVIRKSHWGWFPHFKAMFELHDGSVEIWEYVPIDPSPKWIPPLFFKGKVVKRRYSEVT